MRYFKNFTNFTQNTRLYSTVKSHSPELLPWKGVVGLEIHAQIAANSKLFSGSRVEFAAGVNNCVSQFDASVPGTLPILNRTCVEAGIKTATALSCQINAISMFDRKHYFYADLPAGYQITQQRAPLARHGLLKFPVYIPGVTKKPYEKIARLFQLQLEQDSGKSLHDEFTGRSLVDLNRAGVPLMELVFEPDLENGEEAAALVKELILIMTRIGTCNCKMEEGGLRVDANISVHRKGDPLGIRTEVKNIGSIRGVSQAVSFEIERQIKLLDAGKTIHNETRSWDATSRRTIPMRDKEVMQDYRFMPEPNLPPLHLNLRGDADRRKDLLNVPELVKDLPELPEQTRTKLKNAYGMNQETAVILVNEQKLLDYFTVIIEDNSNRSPKLVVNILLNELLGILHKNKTTLEDCAIPAENIGELVDLLQSDTVNLYLAKLIMQSMVAEPLKRPIHIADENNWKQISNPVEIEKICIEIITKNTKAVDQYRKGKTKVLFALAGEVAKLTDQRANMAIVVEKLKHLLK